MTTALQQQVFALDAKYNTHRAPNNPNFKTLYIRRRSQLLRETERDQDKWKQYLKVRLQLLQRRYGNSLENTQNSSITRTTSRSSIYTNDTFNRVIPTKHATASCALVGGNSIADNYAFIGVHHIFDQWIKICHEGISLQHTKAVTMVKFANNDRSKLCCASADHKLSICCLTDNPPSVTAILEGHTGPVTGFDWSADNDLIASCSLDGTVKLWHANNLTSCIRTLADSTISNGQILCCLFQPANNNLLLIGNSKGDVRIINVSTGRFLKHFSRIGGQILCLATDNNGKLVWAGNDRGEITSLICSIDGNVTRTHRIQLSNGSPSITSLSYRTWISREARDPLLLVNASSNSLLLFKVIDSQRGALQLKRKFPNRHQGRAPRQTDGPDHHQSTVRVCSTFCPLTSFRQGACVVTGSEDGCVYFLDVEKQPNNAAGSGCVVNTLQGHAVTVTGISFCYDESLLATADADGLIIVWKRANVN